MQGWELRELHLRYRQRGAEVRALDGLNLSIAPGECLAVTGPSGCGKSSLLAILGGLQRASAGDCLIDGAPLAAMSARALAEYRAHSVGFVFQQFCLLPHLSLLDNVLLGVDHLPRQQFFARARELLDRVGLVQQLQRFPHEVSGGQAQRAAIARALLRKPRLILADEPTGALDDETAATVMDLLLELAQEGSALMVVTHSEQVAARLPRRVRLMAGRVAA